MASIREARSLRERRRRGALGLSHGHAVGRRSLPSRLLALLPAGATTDCLALVAAATALAILLRPFRNVPFVDDWTYAWSVETLLRDGRLAILDWSSSPNLAQVLWGALFCLPFGFSFTALRVSTWVAATAGVAGLYLLLRALDCPRREALLGAGVVGLHPVFFVLSATFMTDVPFVACTAWASLAFVRAVRTRRSGALVAAAIAASLAVATRIVGIVVPLAMMLALVLTGGAWGRAARRLAIAMAPLAVGALLLWLLPARIEHVADLTYLDDAPVRRIANLRWALPLLPAMAPRTLLFAATVVGLALLPLAAGALGGRGRPPGGAAGGASRATAVGAGSGAARARPAPAVSVWAAAATLVVLGTLWAATALLGIADPPPLADGATWALGELGATGPLVPGHQPPLAPAWILPALTALGLASAALLACRAGLAVRMLPPPVATYLVASVALHLGLMATLWLQYDRYALPLLVPAVALGLAAGPLPHPRRAGALLALVAGLAIVGTRDHLAYSDALWEAVRGLATAGVPAREIDGGYVVNGWALYAHPAAAARDARGEPIVAGLTAAASPARYRIANAPAPAWRVVRRIPYQRWLGRPGAIYVLVRAGKTRSPAPAPRSPNVRRRGAPRRRARLP